MKAEKTETVLGPDWDLNYMLCAPVVYSVGVVLPSQRMRPQFPGRQAETPGE